MKRIIYKNTDNSVGVLIPTDEVLKFATVLQVAEKDVPYEAPYRIVDTTEIPTDRTYRNAWRWNPEWTPDGFGGENNTFDDELLAKYLENRGD